MRVISRSTLRDFWTVYTDCEEQLKSWYKEATEAQWEKPEDIKNIYRTSSILQRNRVVFKIKGNTYRLIVKINYEFGIIWIRFIGTHAEYDKIDANTI